MKKIISPIIFDNSKTPVEGGLYDTGLGPLDPRERCVSVCVELPSQADLAMRTVSIACHAPAPGHSVSRLVSLCIPASLRMQVHDMWSVG